MKSCRTVGTASVESQCLQKGLCSHSKLLVTQSRQPWLYSSPGKEKGQQKRGGEGNVTCHFWMWARQTVLATAVHRRSVWQVSESLLWDRKCICSTFMLFISFDFSVNWEFLASRRTLGTDAYELSWGGRQRANTRGPYAALPMGPSCKI